jgi:uncharacterized protein (DUF2141 family)
MSRLLLSILGAAAALAAPAAPAHAALGPDAPLCNAGSRRPAVLVSVSGFKNRVGRVRVQLYGNNPADFLATGKKLRRIDVPVTPSGPMNVCVAVPGPGTYAIAVRHDADANGKSGWNDGGGFSNNPKITLLDLKPTLREVAFSVGNGVKPIRVVLNYRRGLTIGPIASR